MANEDRDNVEPGEGLTSNIGSIEGNAYANLLMGFGCVVEEGWTFSSGKEIAELCGMTVDILDEAELSGAIDAGIYTSGTINSIDFYQCQVTYKVGTHIASIIASSYGEDVTKDILAWFDKAENAIPYPGILGR